MKDYQKVERNKDFLFFMIYTWYKILKNKVSEWKMNKILSSLIEKEGFDHLSKEKINIKIYIQLWN